MYCNQQKHLKKKSGMVLVYTLIVLMLISFLGLSSLSASLTQEKMVHSTHYHNITFQAADSALSHLEDSLMSFSGDKGISLYTVQKNLQKNNTSGQAISLAGQDFQLWKKGEVTDNGESFKTESKRRQWWQTQATPYKNLEGSADDAQASSQTVESSMALEQGEFFPDDLSVDSRASFRGRQAFHGLANAKNKNKHIESTLRIDILVRYR